MEFSDELRARWESSTSMEFWQWLVTERPTPPHATLLGYTFATPDETTSSEAAITLDWTVPEALLNPTGIAHGGFLSAVLDDAGGLAAASGFAHWVPQLTVHLAVDYLAPVAADIPHRVEGTLVRHGRSSSVADARILDPDGRVCTRASGVFQPNRRFIPRDLWDQAGL